MRIKIFKIFCVLSPILPENADFRYFDPISTFAESSEKGSQIAVGCGFERLRRCVNCSRRVKYSPNGGLDGINFSIFVVV